MSAGPGDPAADEATDGGAPTGVVRAWAATYVAQALSGVFMIGASVVGIRALGANDFGVFWTVASVVFVAYNVGNLGFVHGATHHVARRGTAGVAWTALLLAAGTGLVVTVLTAALTFLLRDRFAELDPVVTVVVLAGIPAHFVVNMAMGVLLGAKEHLKYSAVNLVMFGSLLVCAAVAAYGFRTTLAVGIAFTVAYYGGAAVGLVLVWQRWRGERVRPERRHARDVVRFGVRSYVATLATYLNYRIDILFIAALLGPREAGLYAAAVIIAEMVWFFSLLGGNLLFAHVSAQRDPVARRRTADVATRLVFAASTALALVVGLVGEIVLTTMYSETFADAVGALRILLIGVVAISVSRMLENYVAGIGKPAENIAGGLLAVVVNIVMNVVMIPLWGLEGAAIASVISYVALAAHRASRYLRVDGVGGGPLDFLVVRPSDLGVLRAALVRGRARR